MSDVQRSTAGTITSMGGGEDLSLKAAWLATFPLVSSSLLWWKVTDRLDLPKTWIGLIASGLALAWLLRKKGAAELGPLFGLGSILLLAPLIFAPDDMAARVESWALMAACLTTVSVARRAAPSRTGGAILLLAALPLVVMAWLQAMGVPLLNTGVSGFLGRRVFASLGGPDHMGWLLAGLLPWMAAVYPSPASPQGNGPRDAVPNQTSPVFPSRSRLSSRRMSRQWKFFLWTTAFAALTGATVLSGSRTAWVAGLLGILAWLLLAHPPRRHVFLLLAALSLGTVGAFGLDALTAKSRLSSRTMDLATPTGQAAGRLYILRVESRCLARDMASGNIFGHGPEGFQRTWPGCQRRFLEAHPGDEVFRSDLRHAHFDIGEVWADYGLPGILALAWLLWMLFRRKAWKDIPKAAPAAASLAALCLAGLAGWPAFFAPTALLMALDVGLLLPKQNAHSAGQSPDESGRFHQWKRSWPALALGLLLLSALGLLTRRLDSERLRSQATRLRSLGKPQAALTYCHQATRRDPRNPRAWIECALDMELAGEPRQALQAWVLARRDLPSDAVLQRIQALRHELDARNSASNAH